MGEKIFLRKKFLSEIFFRVIIHLKLENFEAEKIVGVENWVTFWTENATFHCGALQLSQQK